MPEDLLSTVEVAVQIGGLWSDPGCLVRANLIVKRSLALSIVVERRQALSSVMVALQSIIESGIAQLALALDASCNDCSRVLPQQYSQTFPMSRALQSTCRASPSTCHAPLMFRASTAALLQSGA
mmetsp:Transcript_31210/g.48346  ORF Transcript_31210/g.48346 Transcript_31210/m.48346 type:complete len:125 (+) Transcript_31210:801-1175(+)